jgi:hypothetical protein
MQLCLWRPLCVMIASRSNFWRASANQALPQIAIDEIENIRYLWDRVPARGSSLYRDGQAVELLYYRPECAFGQTPVLSWVCDPGWAISPGGKASNRRLGGCGGSIAGGILDTSLNEGPLPTLECLARAPQFGHEVLDLAFVQKIL